MLDRSKDLCLDDEGTIYVVYGPDSFMTDVHKELRDFWGGGNRRRWYKREAILPARSDGNVEGDK